MGLYKRAVEAQVSREEICEETGDVAACCVLVVLCLLGIWSTQVRCSVGRAELAGPISFYLDAVQNKLSFL